MLGDDFAGRWETVRSFRGSELVGKRYKRPLDWVEYKDGKHEVIIGESFVSADEGTGVVHMAPAFGADDYAAGQRNGLAFLQPVNLRGEFPAEHAARGRNVRQGSGRRNPRRAEAARRALEIDAARARVSALLALRDAAALLRAHFLVHPHDGIQGRDARSQLARRLAPGGNRIRTVRRVADQQHRLGGLARPVLGNAASDLGMRPRRRSHAEAIAGFAELVGTIRVKRSPRRSIRTSRSSTSYTWKCKCGGTMTRTPEVIDAWFDSGSMPFAQWHFPFENRDKFERYYPADFIAEGIDQTRGWFYSLLAIATGLGDALPNNLLAHEAAFAGSRRHRAVSRPSSSTISCSTPRDRKCPSDSATSSTRRR